MATIFTDDFNSYNDGDLDGQGDWADFYGDTEIFDIQGDTVFEGAKAVKVVNPSDLSKVKKEGTARNEGKISIYIRDSNTTDGAFLQVREGTSYCMQFGLMGYLLGAGKIGVYEGGSDAGWRDTGLTYTANTWVLIEVEWQDTGGSNPQYRLRADGSEWTEWYEAGSDWTTGVDNILLCVDGGTHTSYFDYIAENPYEEPSDEVVNAVFFGANF